jgi:hypothetical protein
MHWCELQWQVANRGGSAAVPMSLDDERVMKMACEHLWLTLVLAEAMFGGEGGGAVLATHGRRYCGAPSMA